MAPIYDNFDSVSVSSTEISNSSGNGTASETHDEWWYPLIDDSPIITVSGCGWLVLSAWAYLFGIVVNSLSADAFAEINWLILLCLIQIMIVVVVLTGVALRDLKKSGQLWWLGHTLTAIMYVTLAFYQLSWPALFVRDMIIASSPTKFYFLPRMYTSTLLSSSLSLLPFLYG